MHRAERVERHVAQRLHRLERRHVGDHADDGVAPLGL
jgi:hypothetical protein